MKLEDQVCSPPWQGQVFTGTEASARAKMLVYLIEQGVVKPMPTERESGQ